MLKSLGTKFKQVCLSSFMQVFPTLIYCFQACQDKKAHRRCLLPTWHQVCTQIEALINKCACTHDLNDLDFKDDIEGNSDCSGNAEALVQPKKSDIKKDVCTAIIWCPDPNVQRRPCSNNTDLIGRLADAFNPHALQGSWRRPFLLLSSKLPNFHPHPTTSWCQ